MKFIHIIIKYILIKNFILLFSLYNMKFYLENYFYIFKWKNKYLSFKNSKQSNFLTNPSKSNKFFLNNRTTPRIRLFRVYLIHNFTLLYIINEKIHISTQKKIIVINDLNIKNRWFKFNLNIFFFPKYVDY